MRLNLFSLIAAAILLFASEAAAQESECCAPLLLPVGARPVAMGQALTARSGRDGIFANPAGLADVTDDEFVIHHTTLPDDAQLTTFGLVIHSAVAGVFSLTYRLIDFGDTEITDENQNVIGRSGLIDQLLIASFATRVTTNWRAGVTYKLYDFRDSCEGVCGARFQGTTHLFDAGAEFQSARSPNLRVGVALTHAGLALQIRNAAQADPTPARFRLGAAYEIGHLVQQDTAIKIWAHADVIQPLRNAGTPALNIGAEAILNETIYLRAGYAATSYGVTYGGPGVGVGLRYQRFDVSVAKAFSTPLDDDPVQVTFGVRF